MNPDARHADLIASFDAALDIAQRSLTMARALAEGARVGMLPPEATLGAYLARIERDQGRVAELMEHLQRLRATTPKA
jgi:hypothetical protein